MDNLKRIRISWNLVVSQTFQRMFPKWIVTSFDHVLSFLFPLFAKMNLEEPHTWIVLNTSRSISIISFRNAK